MYFADVTLTVHLTTRLWARAEKLLDQWWESNPHPVTGCIRTQMLSLKATGFNAKYHTT